MKAVIDIRNKWLRRIVLIAAIGPAVVLYAVYYAVVDGVLPVVRELPDAFVATWRGRD